MTHIYSRAAVVCVMLVATTVFLANARRAEVSVARDMFATFPLQIGDWQGKPDPPLDADILRVLGVDDYLSRIYYRPDGSAVGVYMGFYGSQRQGDTIHSPLNCLPGAGWEPVSDRRLTISDIDGSGRDVMVNRYVVQKGLDRQLVLYWYQSHGRVIASEYTSRLYLIRDAIALNRTDGSMVRVIAPIDPRLDDDGAAAEQMAVQFVRTVFPHLPPYLGR